MEEAAEVLTRLTRIERLEREGARADALLAELRLLVDEAERWLRAEPSAPPAATRALDDTRAALGAAGGAHLGSAASGSGAPLGGPGGGAGLW